jgi:alpha-glucosidase
MKPTRLLLGALLAAAPLWCRAENVGRVMAYRQTAHGIEGRTASVQFSVSVYSAHVVRVRVSRNGAVQRRSYALTEGLEPNQDRFTVRESDRRILISTAALVAEIEQQPELRITFKDPHGNVINEDLPGAGMGITFTGNKVTVYKRLQPDERFIGMGEQLGDLDRRGTVLTLKNTDNYRYDDPRVPMYVSIPFFTGLHHRHVYGLFFNNSYRSVFNFGASNRRFASYSFDGGDLDEFFMYDDSVPDILAHYTSLTGRMPLPPKWSIGYQQSRCSYYPQAQVMFIARTFRDKQIPLDGIVLDADYLQDYQPFRINRQRFPDIKRMAGDLAAMNIELTASVNPAIAIDDSYPAHRTGLQQDVFLRYTDGELYQADIAPNTSHFPDFSSPRARQWWIENMKIYQQLGINGYWNDMNEPAIDGQAMPDNVVFDFDGQPTTALEGQNYYGMLMARASFEAFGKYGGNRRPFVLSRAGFAGIQRYAAVWSGDNQAKDEHILLGVLLINQMGLSGVPFTGPDIGGYIGDGNKELYRRWIEVGVFSPYLRSHREQLAAANEPWAYGEEAEAIAKSYLEFRYQLLPYLYSTFYEASQTGMPISRSLSIDNPFDASIYERKYQYEFVFGDALLVNPLTSREDTKTTYLPAGQWYDAFTDQTLAGGQQVTAPYPAYKLPIFVRASSIIPMYGKLQSTSDDPGEVLTVHVYYGSEAHQFNYYDDDGRSLNYRAGDYYRRTIGFYPDQRRLVFSRPQGNYPAPFKRIRLVLHGFSALRTVTVNNQPLIAQPTTVRLLDPLIYLQDVYNDKGFVQGLRDQDAMAPQQTVLFDDAAELVVRWDAPQATALTGPRPDDTLVKNSRSGPARTDPDRHRWR